MRTAAQQEDPAPALRETDKPEKRKEKKRRKALGRVNNYFKQSMMQAQVTIAAK